MQIIKSGEKELRERIKSSGMRMNKTKLSVFETLLTAGEPMSIQEIIQNVPNAHYVSVYRTVDALYKAGVVVRVPQGFKNLFELSDLFNNHHHHISCEKCGKFSRIDDKKIESMIEKISQDSGYESTNHHLELYGLCQNCR